MKIVREPWRTLRVEAPAYPSIPQVRRVCRLLRRSGMKADLHACHPDNRGWAARPARVPYDPRFDMDEEFRPVQGPPFAHVLTLEHGEYERTLDDEHPYAIVPGVDDLWDAIEGQGLCVMLTGQDWTEKGLRFEATVGHLHYEGREAMIEGRGPTRQAALFAAAYAVERVTRNWRFGLGATGLLRPWPWRKLRE